MCASRPPIRCCTITRAAHFNMPVHGRLTALGWFRIDTIDDDLGRSAAGGVARAGFDRMVAEVCLGKVGAVRHEGCRGLPATVVTGSSSSRCAASSAPC